MDTKETSIFRYWIAVTIWAVTLLILVLSTGFMVFSVPKMNAYIDTYNYGLLYNAFHAMELDRSHILPSMITMILTVILLVMILVQIIRAWLDMAKVSWTMILSLIRNENNLEEQGSLFFDLLLFNKETEILAETEELELDPQDAKSSLIGRVLIRIGKAWGYFITTHVVAVIPYLLLTIYYLLAGNDVF